MTLQSATVTSFGGLDLRADPEESNRALDLLNVELDRDGRVRSRDGYSKVTANPGPGRYDSLFAVATASSVSSVNAFPGTQADDSAVGTVAWSNTGNIVNTDASYATAALNGNTSHYLKATNFGFAVPGTATITGVGVEIVRKCSAGVVADSAVKLVKGGTVTGNNLGLGLGSGWQVVPVHITYGGSSNLWGTTLAPADVNAANFGVVLSALGTIAGVPDTASVDSVKVTVYYQPAASLVVGAITGTQIDVIAADGSVSATAATGSDTGPSSFAAFGSPTTSATYIANSGTTVRKLVGTTFSTPAGMPKCKFLAVQKPDNRLVAANVNVIPTGSGATASTSLVVFSDAGFPEVWNGTSGGAPANGNQYVYLTPGDNEDIQGMVAWKNDVYVFKSTRFFRFYGNGADNTGLPVFNFREITGAGMVAPLAVAAAPNGVFFLDRRGIYFTTGGAPQRISSPVDPLFLDGESDAYLSGIINPSAIGQASMAWFADRLYVGLPLGAATTNSHTLVFDPERQQWTLWDIPMGAMSASAQQPARLLFTYAQGTSDIGQYAQNAYTDDAGTPISSRYRWGFIDAGTPEQEKWIRSMELTGSGSVSVKTAVNDATALSSAVTVAMGTAPAVSTGRWSAGTRGRNLSVEVSASAAWSLSHLSLDVAATRAPTLRAA